MGALMDGILVGATGGSSFGPVMEGDMDGILVGAIVGGTLDSISPAMTACLVGSTRASTTSARVRTLAPATNWLVFLVPFTTFAKGILKAWIILTAIATGGPSLERVAIVSV
jgi:hypothetical protein